MLATKDTTSTNLTNALKNLRMANINNMLFQIKIGRYEAIINTLNKFNFKYTDEERMYFMTEATSAMDASNCKELGPILDLITVKCMM